MADLNSLEKQIDTLAQGMMRELTEIKTDIKGIKDHLEVVDQKLERIERNQLTEKENTILLETRVSKLEEPAAH